jgi:hypothetical protein
LRIDGKFICFPDVRRSWRAGSHRLVTIAIPSIDAVETAASGSRMREDDRMVRLSLLGDEAARTRRFMWCRSRGGVPGFVTDLAADAAFATL